MSAPLKLWQALSPEGFAALVAGDFEKFSRGGYEQLRNQSLILDWQPVDIEWCRNRKSDRLGEMGTLYTVNDVCFRRSDSQKLFPTLPADVELLPLRLGDEDWVLLNCLRSATAIDRESSDLWITTLPDLPEYKGVQPWISEIRWINLVEPWALAERWEVLCVPASTDTMAYRHLVLTDVFVDRVRSLGLRGLDFKHVGYIVADASQAVPKPPALPPPASKPSKRKPPNLTSSPLPADEQIEIASVGAEWRQRLQLAADASSQTILQRITEEMQKLRPAFWTISAEERLDASLGLSAIYGELLRSACGWSWAELRESRSKRWIAMLAPSGNHALALVPYVQQQIQSEAPTVALLFNMIAVGDLPAAEPGQIRVVA
jgi:hypothetical protein